MFYTFKTLRHTFCQWLAGFVCPHVTTCTGAEFDQSIPTILLRLSSIVTSRQVLSIFPMRSFIPIVRNPCLWCNLILPVFSGKTPACKVQIPFNSDPAAARLYRVVFKSFHYPRCRAIVSRGLQFISLPNNYHIGQKTLFACIVNGIAVN